MTLDPRILRRLQRNADYRAVFGSPAGQRVLADILRDGCVARHVHVPGDPCSTAYNDGRRTGALRIANILKLDDEEILRRAREGDDDHGQG